jgi:hypothetical protein
MNSGYCEGLEIDRIDSSKNYCAENCRFVTCQQNIANRDAAKTSSSIRFAHLVKNYRPFVCVETQELFYNQCDAVMKLGIRAGNLCQALKGRIKKVKGLSFKYLNINSEAEVKTFVST